MENDIIRKQKQNFELRKEEIRKSSAELPDPISLKEFQTEGNFFSWNKHNVTGNEINELLVKPLHKALIKQNTTTQSIYKILDDVYHALEFLDSEYLAGIITAVQSAEAASNQAKSASDKATIASNQALDASAKASAAQADIKRTIEAIQKTVSTLKDFREKVDKRIQSLEQDRDSLFDVTQNLQDVSLIMNSIKHLGDIDTIWKDVEEHKVNLTDLYKLVDNFIQETRTEEYAIRTSFAELLSAQQKKNKQVDKRIKIAYCISGGSVILSLIQLLLLLLEIL